jgi:DNA-directed RNA polymerase subunit M/transcription elongation factor TFIIS
MPRKTPAAPAALPRDGSCRDDIRGSFVDCLGRCPAAPGAFVATNQGSLADVARRLERGCYNRALELCKESADNHKRRWDSVMFLADLDCEGRVAAHLAAGGGPSLPPALAKILAGEWHPQALGAMTADQLCPQAGEAERSLIGRRSLQKVDEKVSSLFSCPQCRARRCTYRQVQIGAADEPSTFMCTCLSCGANFEGRG